MIANRREPTLGTFPEIEEIRTTTREANSSLYEPSSAEDSKRVVWLVLIVAGTAIGGLIAYFAARWYETRQVEVVLQSFARTVTDVSVQAQREAALVSERLHLADAA